MKDARERWDVWLVQAQRFARRENYIDALGRVRLVLAELDEAIASPGDAPELRKFRHRVERRMTAIRKQFEEWNGQIAARRAKWMETADEEMSRPLPLAPDELI